jgi:hypothetical protein
MHFVTPSLYADAVYFGIIHSLTSFSLPSPPSPLRQSHYYKHVTYMYVYVYTYVCMIMRVFMYKFIFQG